MIRATFYKDGENYFGFDIKGHSGYAESGSDIVCASISSMAMLFVNMANDVFRVPFDFSSKEDTAEMSFSIKTESEAMSKALDTFMKCVSFVADEYPEFVDVKNKTVRFKAKT